MSPTNLNPGFAKTDFAGQVFSDERIGIMCPLKDPLEGRQLLTSESGSVPPRLLLRSFLHHILDLVSAEAALLSLLHAVTPRLVFGEMRYLGHGDVGFVMKHLYELALVNGHRGLELMTIF